MTLALTLLEVRSQKGTEIYVTATYLSLDNRIERGSRFLCGGKNDLLGSIILKFNYQIHLLNLFKGSLKFKVYNNLSIHNLIRLDAGSFVQMNQRPSV